MHESEKGKWSCSVMFNSMWSHGLQNTRLPCPSPAPGVCSNSRPSSWWCHPTISSSVVPFSSCPQSFPPSESFPMSQFFKSGGQSIRASASASVFPASIQGWFPLWLMTYETLGLINPISVPLTSFYSMRWGRNGVKVRTWPIGSYKDLSSVIYSDQILALSLATCLSLGLSPTLFPHLQS